MDLPFIGHHPTVELLRRFIANPASYVQNVFFFNGPAGCGKLLVAKWFASQISDSRDIKTLVFDKDVRSLKIKERSRVFPKLFEEMGYRARNGVCRTYIIDLQVPLDEIISNSLLKQFEEVMPGNTIILVAPNQDYLLSTIVSRTKPVNFDSLKIPDVWQILRSQGYSEEDIQVYLQCYGSNLSLVKSMPIADLTELRDYLYEMITVMTAYHFIEMGEVAKKFDEYFDECMSILMNWAGGYMLDPAWSQQLSRLIDLLLDVAALEGMKKRSLWIERAFMKYHGWVMPEIKTAYECME